LLADPTWIRESVAQYYDFVDVIVVSYDSRSKGWTGIDIPVSECLALIKQIDVHGKVVEIVGDYSSGDESPIDKDTRQRQDCVDCLSDRVDWIIQLDTDEWFPDVSELISIAEDMSVDVSGIEWPMKVLFRKVGQHQYLAVTDNNRNSVYEYPGPVLIRSKVKLVDARRTSGTVVRYCVTDDVSSLQLSGSHVLGIRLRRELNHRQVIVHNSWARSRDVVYRKVTSWGHNQGVRSTLYFWFVWFPAPFTWRIISDFHPFAKGLWPRLSLFSFDGVNEK
jgi:hypothetical protein